MNADRLARAWVTVYTLGLPEPVRADRAAEIESDLWEQRATLRAGVRAELAIASRAARGALDDLGWRCAGRERTLLPGARAIIAALGWTVALASYLFFVAGHAVSATPLVGLSPFGEDSEPGERLVYAGISLTVCALLVAGALAIRRRPRLGALLTATGAVVTPVAFWWGAPVYGPAATAITAAAFVLARRRRRRPPDGSADPVRCPCAGADPVGSPGGTVVARARRDATGRREPEVWR